MEDNLLRACCSKPVLDLREEEGLSDWTWWTWWFVLDGQLAWVFSQTAHLLVIFATSRHTRGFAEDGLKKNWKYPVRFGAKCLADVRGQRSERVETTEKQQELWATTGCDLLVSNSAECEHMRPWSFMYLERRTCVVLIKWPVSVHFYDCNKLSQFLFVLLVLRRLRVSCKVLFLLPALKSLTALGSCCPAFTHLHTPRLTSAFLLTHKSITSSFLLHADGIILLPGLLGNSNTFCCYF